MIIDLKFVSILAFVVLGQNGKNGTDDQDGIRGTRTTVYIAYQVVELEFLLMLFGGMITVIGVGEYYEMYLYERFRLYL